LSEVGERAIGSDFITFHSALSERGQKGQHFVFGFVTRRCRAPAKDIVGIFGGSGGSGGKLVKGLTTLNAARKEILTALWEV